MLPMIQNKYTGISPVISKLSRIAATMLVAVPTTSKTSRLGF
jgi:hypothetical protein